MIKWRKGKEATKKPSRSFALFPFCIITPSLCYSTHAISSTGNMKPAANVSSQACFQTVPNLTALLHVSVVIIAFSLGITYLHESSAVLFKPAGSAVKLCLLKSSSWGNPWISGQVAIVWVRNLFICLQNNSEQLLQTLAVQTQWPFLDVLQLVKLTLERKWWWSSSPYTGILKEFGRFLDCRMKLRMAMSQLMNRNAYLVYLHLK